MIYLTTGDHHRSKPDGPEPAGVGGPWNLKNHWISPSLRFTCTSVPTATLNQDSCRANWNRNHFWSTKKRNVMLCFRLGWYQGIFSNLLLLLCWNYTPTHLVWILKKRTGYSNQLKEAVVPIISNQVCNSNDYRQCQITPCMICAGHFHQSPCQAGISRIVFTKLMYRFRKIASVDPWSKGDSGGPLFCSMEDGMMRLSGIYSYGRCGDDETKPSVRDQQTFSLK